MVESKLAVHDVPVGQALEVAVGKGATVDMVVDGFVYVGCFCGEDMWVGKLGSFVMGCQYTLRK
jgi:hypothetical protein